MGILEIENRTENWKTARYFAPLLKDGDLRLALAKKLGEPSKTQPCDVHIELYWKGMRDYLHQTKKRKNDKLLDKHNMEDFAGRYTRLFPNLREKVKEFQSEEGLKLTYPTGPNYNPSSENRTKLCSNLVNTEIDVVLETPTHLFIGEAKGEMDLGGNGNLVLVHQLIRQYVMARVLVDRLESKQRVVPFVVRNKPQGREQIQVEFMIAQRWLRPKNVLSWDDIGALHP